MKQTWSVVVVHGDGGAKAEAVKFCGRLTERFWDHFDLDVKWWAFGDLTLPDQAAVAARAAARADFIVFSICGDPTLPEHLQSWMENWILDRGDREGILIGLFTGASAAEAALTRSHAHLRDAAHRSGMDYLAELPESFCWPIQESLESYTERARQTSSVLDEILHRPAAGGERNRATID